MAAFLSQTWFDTLEELNANAGELNLPPTLANLVINITISTDTPVMLHLKAGKLSRHHSKDAISTITIDKETLSKVILDNDTDAAVEAFMTGKVRIDGDMAQVMTLQSAKPSQEQKALYKQIKAMTQFD
ncbi:MAG: SCP2 sterol-binding domain-containing protein [Moraxella sp.]|nr:SCP2 sterol-binding domain-containing protein [Moraxella sp.]